MNEWALTDAEIASAWNCDLRVQHLLFSGKRAEDVREGDRAIATAAQKKLVEWLENHTESFDNFEIQQFFMEWEDEPFLAVGDRYIKQVDWHTLKAALGVK